MARLLALEWNDNEARVAVANARGSRLVFEQAFSIGLRPPSPEEEDADESIGEQIATALAARGVGRGETLVAIGRTEIELRQLSLPPAPDAELPDMVRFQAVREFNALDERWPLDFLPLDDDPEQPRTVLAAAIAPHLVESIKKTCQAASLKPHRMILRPCAAASLLRRSDEATTGQVRLLVDLLGSEADLTVTLDGTVIFLRSARLPIDPLVDESGVGPLVSEIRRTMAAAHNQLGNQRIERIVLFGSRQKHGELADQIGDKVDKPTELFDPFANLTLGGELGRELPDHPGRFAPLLGVLLDEHESSAHAIDFLNPRRRPEPPSKRNTFVLAGLVATLLVLGFIGVKAIQKQKLIEEVQGLDQDVAKYEPLAAEAELDMKAAEVISEWEANSVVWLDELYRISKESPSAEDIMITSLDLKQERGDLAKGRMTVNGLARNAEVIKPTEEDLRDTTHRVIPGKTIDDSKSKSRYSVRFDLSILVSPEVKQ